MTPEGTLRGDAVHVGGDARQRFHDSRGYGRPVEGNEIALTRIEAAHLLFRGDLSAVVVDGDALEFEAFFVRAAAASTRFTVRFLVYSDLRDRGFYLSPAREGWPGGRHAAADAVDFVVYERGSDPEDGAVAHHVRVVGERETIAAADVAGQTLAVVDEESDLTYFGATTPELDGATPYQPPAGLAGVLLADRVVVWDAPPDLYQHGFYGQPLSGRDSDLGGALQLSLLEAAALADAGALALTETVDAAAATVDDDAETPASDATDDYAAIVARGRAVEGERFDRRLRTYEDLRGRDLVPKTGFKFGADFRTYRDVETVEDLPHSEHLVRVVQADHTFEPRELSLDVRLAGGVRKRMLFALVEGDGNGVRGGDGAADEIEYVEIGRLTP
ncbi:tRNA-intron lyase [Haloparvum sp. PAK95]|uniref:tRNA-intron lyase n=1 Tax=Haloparvum sp. PAK95 TaxID=3418962 RepID=UPI003D2ED997